MLPSVREGGHQGEAVHLSSGSRSSCTLTCPTTETKHRGALLAEKRTGLHYLLCLDEVLWGRRRCRRRRLLVKEATGNEMVDGLQQWKGGQSNPKQ